MAVFSQLTESTALAAAAPICPSCSREGNLFRNDFHAETSLGNTNPETPSSISLSMGPLGTLATARPHAMYSGIFSVEKGRIPL